jgi:phospholipid/cholesterol/gamma-HCH transport system permease protein
MAQTPSVDIDETQRQLRIGGDWSVESLPVRGTLREAVERNGGAWTVHVEDVGTWDARLSALLLQLTRSVESRGDHLELIGADDAQRKLLALAMATPEYKQPATSPRRFLSVAALRRWLHDIGDGFLESLAFLGDAVRALLVTLAGRGAMRGRELIGACFQAGPNALGIIALTSVLVGMILAYLGAAQLRQFGAEIYVADLVGIGMLREMGPLMTAVVMSGRTGAAYAAQLSTMQGNEEIDAISTLGINPMEYLVAPRIIGLVCMMPLLVIFANTLGVLGGALVAGGMGVTLLQYLSQLEGAFSFTHLTIGLCKSLVFALLIAIAGCRAGLSAERSSAAVGQATTEAVVTAIVYLIVADAAINIICQQLNI